MRWTKTLVAVALLALTTLTLPATAGSGRWEGLGTVTVSDRLDHDTMPVTRGQGTFTAIKLKVARHAVQFRSVKIHFANGESQEVELRDQIPAGGESRVIDVLGGDRGIRSIEFLYDAQSVRGRKATVRVFGRN